MTASFWNPRPHPTYSAEARKAYHAGYSDGYHRYPYGSGDENPRDVYATGYREGSSDRISEGNHD